MSLSKKLVIFALLTFFAFNANAEIQKGDKTVSIFAALISTDINDTLFLEAAGGIFYTDVIELQGSVSLLDSGNFTSTAFGGNANLYLPNNKNPDFLPYVGAGARLTLLDAGAFTDTQFGINGQAGIKQFLSEDVAINYQAQLVLSDDTTFILSAGLTVFID